MQRYIISGIQQMGIGCEDFAQSWAWYIKMFQTDIRVLEDDTVAERMLPYTGGVPQKRHACIALNLQGGGGFEIWQYSQRKPVPLPFPIQCGSVGIFGCKIKSRDVLRFRQELLTKKCDVGPLCADPSGLPVFWIRDPWGNYFQVVGDKSVLIDRNQLSGGVVGAVIGVRDIERALPLYRDLLGYTSVVYDKEGVFADFEYFPNGGNRFRRVLLTTPEPPKEGAFSQLYGRGSIELVQDMSVPQQKIYEGRFWGDPGFIQLCLDVTHLDEFEKVSASMGYPFTVDSARNASQFKMGDGQGRFVYIEDPDGTLIELVEAEKITLLRHPRITLSLKRRKSYRPLPKILFRIMGMKKVSF